MDKANEYIERINRVIDYIELNIADKIDLDTLARIACFSKYHFHRIFYSFTDEPLYSFINRIRVERAAALLLSSKKTITDIAFSSGFNDSATFSRAFKKHFKLSAMEWRKQKNSNIHQALKKKHLYNYKSNKTKESIIQPEAVDFTQFPEMTIAYIRHTGSYAGNSSLFHSLNKKLIHWAALHELVHLSLRMKNMVKHGNRFFGQ